MSERFKVGDWVRVKADVSKADEYWPPEVEHGAVGYIEALSHIDGPHEYWVVAFQMPDGRILKSGAENFDLERANAIDRLGQVAD